MQEQETATPEILVASNTDLDSLKKINCQVGSEIVNGECVLPPPSVNVTNVRNEMTSTPTGTKAKRKARSTRRRLNAMISNASLHFSDTDSEGELAVARNASPNPTTKNSIENHLLHPVISVTPDASDDSSYVGGERGSNYIENLTDVDEIYTSEPEGTNEANPNKKKYSLAVAENPLQGETDLEDVSNDEEDVQPPIFVKPRNDILCDFNGETITTKEGDGPFSVEVRNQMSVDEPKIVSDTPDIVVMPTTDSEDMEASDDDDELEGACGRQRDSLEDFDVLAASQIVMTNLDKSEQLLVVKDPEDVISDCHTDVEDIE